jgi:hypothetical protein
MPLQVWATLLNENPSTHDLQYVSVKLQVKQFYAEEHTAQVLVDVK